MRGIRLTGVAAVAAIGVALAGCTGGGTSTVRPAGNTAPAGGGTQTGGGTSPASASPSPTPSGPAVTITPANGAKGADPAKGITVTTHGGTLKNVSVRTAGDPVSGAYASGKAAWHSTWALDVSQSYTVTATATAANGTTTTQTATFRTLTPSSTFSTHIVEGYQQTYGVGMPIILYFSAPVKNKAAVEQALQIKTSKPVTGAWYWDEPCGMAADCLYFRPRDYWPAGTAVSFTGHLNGVEASPGVYGDHTLTQAFTIGRSVIAVGNTHTHRTQIYVDGKLKYNWPISSGRPGDDTPDGSYLTIEKENPVEMKGPGYDLKVPYSVRFTWSGDYYHDAYWSVGEQGFQNVSHGCVNLSPADSQIYYNLAVPGDPITIKGSPKAGAWDNGYTMWFLDWNQYLKGSALHEAVRAGPDGSTFVNPATLPPDTSKAPLQTAPYGNAST